MCKKVFLFFSNYLCNGQDMFGCQGPHQCHCDTVNHSGTSLRSSWGSWCQAQVAFSLGLACTPGISYKTSSFNYKNKSPSLPSRMFHVIPLWRKWG